MSGSDMDIEPILRDEASFESREEPGVFLNTVAKRDQWDRNVRESRRKRAERQAERREQAEEAERQRDEANRRATERARERLRRHGNSK